MYMDDVAIYVLGGIGFISFILLAGFAEGGNMIAALICLVIMVGSFNVALYLDNKIEAKRKR